MPTRGLHLTVLWVLGDRGWRAFDQVVSDLESVDALPSTMHPRASVSQALHRLIVTGAAERRPLDGRSYEYRVIGGA